MRASRALTALVASILSIGPTVAAAQTDYTEIPLLASDGQMRDLFGFAVAATDDYVAVSAPVDDRYCCRPGFVYVFSRDDWTQQAQLQALDPVWGQLFGWAIAASGDTILVGAFAAAPSGIYRGGAAYVFVRDSTGAWSQQAKLVASDVSFNARFGLSVALDGDTALVGAYGESGYRGSAYVFRRSGSVWTEEARLTPPPPASEASFGWSVAVEGETAVIGAPGVDSVYVFERLNATWLLTARLAAADSVQSDGFGSSVDLSGNTLVVGAPYKDNYTGAAYAFVRSRNNWVEEARLSAPGSSYNYGFVVRIDGDTAAVGAPNESYDYGAAYVFGRDEAGWGAPLRLTPSDPQQEKFGNAIAVADRAVVVGAYAWPGPGTPNEYTGKAYVYLRSPTVSELAADLVAFVDGSIADGTLVGIGPGASARNRLRVVRNHIATASAFIAKGKSAPACSHLINAYRKMDGTAPDFAGGPAAADTRDRIIELRATLGCPPSAQQTIRDIGTLPGGSFSEAYAINDRGQVVGGSETASGGVHAFLWEEGVVIDLGALTGGDYSQAFNINDKGQIVGASETTGPGCDPAPFNACTHAFLWEEGTMTPLRPLGGPFSYAYGINNRGQVAGLSTTASGEYHAVTWTPEGHITDLGVLPGDNFGQANAINDRGQIVGWSSGETTRAFVWEKGVMSELGTLNGSYSAAVDINKHGLIVGTGDDNGTYLPVIWSRDGVTALPLLPGADFGEVGRANDRGIVVGWMQYSSPIYSAVPVIWVDGRVVELPSLSPPPDLSNWTAAYDVNNRGDVVGVSNGRAVLWVQP